ncbi:MAG: nitrogen fixation protein NifW [Methylobacter sp.]|nr:MAG: nitrogen fixation protein NifW [Methylobacter sp.]PPD20198.1 MAG: nitrogen fixation protein NifW [Methylobacter sp.]
MHPVLTHLYTFSAAEEFLDFLGITYDPEIVHVNRLHILKRFNQYLGQSPVPEDVDDNTARETCTALLTRAYNDFVKSNAAQEKVFKVFQDQDGKSISLDKIKMSLPSQN